MRIQHLLLFSFFLTLIQVCSTGKARELIPTEDTNAENQELTTTIKIDSILIEQRVFQDFSQVGKKDEFYICIRGKSITEGQVFFTILGHDKTTILREEFPSYLLMNYGFEGDIESATDREKYIKTRIQDFFSDDKFYFPAIKPEEDFSEEYSDKEIWNDIQSDRTAIGFFYLIGEEDGRKIAFSKRTKKIVMYFNCC